MTPRLLDVLRDDSGQDLLEYALLGAFVAIVGGLLWQTILAAVRDKYESYNSNVPMRWELDDPAGGS